MTLRKTHDSFDPYAGYSAFKRYMDRVHGYHHPYDWADLNLASKARFAARALIPRERRAVAREEDTHA